MKTYQARAGQLLAPGVYCSMLLVYSLAYGQTADEDPRKSEFEPQRILNVEGGFS